MKATIDKRLTRLEVKRSPTVAVCCVQIGDGPAIRSNGAVCTLAHPDKATIGGPKSIRSNIGTHHDP